MAPFLSFGITKIDNIFYNANFFAIIFKKTLFLRDFQLHSRSDISPDSIELHNVLRADARICLRNLVERVT